MNDFFSLTADDYEDYIDLDSVLTDSVERFRSILNAAALHAGMPEPIIMYKKLQLDDKVFVGRYIVGTFEQGAQILLDADNLLKLAAEKGPVDKTIHETIAHEFGHAIQDQQGLLTEREAEFHGFCNQCKERVGMPGEHEAVCYARNLMRSDYLSATDLLLNHLQTLRGE